MAAENGVAVPSKARTPLTNEVNLEMSKTRLALVFAVALLAVACSTAPPPPASEKPAALGSIERLDPVFDELVPKDAQLEKVAGGFTFTEGPLWRLPAPSGSATWWATWCANGLQTEP